MQASSHGTVQNTPISSAESSETLVVETTMSNKNIVTSTTHIVPTSSINEYSSSTQHQIKETTSSVQEMKPAPSSHTSKSSTVRVSNLSQLTHTAGSIPETTTTQLSMLNKKVQTSSSAIIASEISSTTDISVQNPSSTVVLIEHSTFSTSIMTSKASNVVKNFQTTKSSHQSSSPSVVQPKTSPSASSISAIHTHHRHTTTEANQKNFQSTIAMSSTASAVHSHTTPNNPASSETTNFIRAQSSSFQNAFSTSSFTFVSMDNNIIPTSSSSHVHSKIGEIRSTGTTKVLSPTSMFESSSQVDHLDIQDSQSTTTVSSIVTSYVVSSSPTISAAQSSPTSFSMNSLPTSHAINPLPTTYAAKSSPTSHTVNSSPTNSSEISSPRSDAVNSSPSSYVMSLLNTSFIVGQQNTAKISTSVTHHASPSVVMHTISENSTTIKIQLSKTFTTPVVSSSVWIPPYYYPWSNWSKCSRECGGGYTHQTRNCSEHDACSDLGPSINTTICNLHHCDGKFISLIICVALGTCKSDPKLIQI